MKETQMRFTTQSWLSSELVNHSLEECQTMIDTQYDKVRKQTDTMNMTFSSIMQDKEEKDAAEVQRKIREKQLRIRKTDLQLEKEHYEGRAIGALRNCMQKNVKIFLKADFEKRKTYLRVAEDEKERNEKEKLKNDSLF